MKRLLSIFIAVVFVVMLLVPSSVAFASGEVQYPFDHSSIEDDFVDKSYSDVFEVDKDISIYFAEYGYSASSLEDYALYIYVYNPKKIAFYPDSVNNYLQMTVRYDNEGKAYGFVKRKLQFCSQTDDGLITKYRVVFYPQNNMLDSAARKYSVSSIELETKAGIKDYSIANEYIFTGFSKGYGSDESTLSSTVNRFETISFDTYHTSYRVQSSEVGKYYDIQSVWFSIRDKYTAEYGNIDSLKAQWIERLTTPILVLDNASRVNDFNEILCENVSSDFPYAVLWGDGLGPPYKYHFNYDSLEWNQKNNWTLYDLEQYGLVNVKVPYLNYCFYAEDVFTPENVVVSSQELMNYLNMKEWGDYLFETEDRSNYDDPVTFKATDVNLLQSYQVNDFWKRLLSLGIIGPTEVADAVPYKAIQLVDFADKNLNSAAFAEKYKVGVSEAEDIQNDLMESRDTYILAYSVTPYYAWSNDKIAIIGDSCVSHSLNYTGPGLNLNDGQFHGIVAQTTAIEAFDIIEVTFYKNEVYTTLAVVSDPTNYVSSITVPTTPSNVGCSCDEGCWFCEGDCGEDCDCLWKYIAMLFCIVIVLVIFAPLIPYIVSFVAKLISLLIQLLLPFKVIADLIKKRKNENKDDENRRE